MTLARVWVWVIMTDVPERQELAARYIEMAVQADNMAAWNAENDTLPTQPTALAHLISDYDLKQFVNKLLENAYPYPNLDVYPQMQEAILRAIQDVLDGVASPERAAESASTVVNGLR